MYEATCNAPNGPWGKLPSDIKLKDVKNLDGPNESYIGKGKKVDSVECL